MQRREIEYRKRKIELMEKALAGADVAEAPQTQAIEAATKMDFCATCSLEPPLRSYHCPFCNRCVATFDHHCFFIGTCIGERNHCRFYWFILLSCMEVSTCLGIIHSSFHTEATLQLWLRTNGMALTAAMFFWVLVLFF
ncbi:hypothetical protein SPRG_12735 [Saprolegnia parasitica CBS 223.65]|uniref:Palmitoyltransferase n=1 Tax=Saprolegnia parasitica (strain CBS 223.65) TaxID=695850 RepID=A0A067BV81_SAPPC|nr:hypothetical protein SPRG_12735 [Saprolegnia parasitica CBS 223.65]KDO22454.1 hypothetical protein SPRG_12735 [Saprolegnia parasitica CBS 223.65]|eukprot:XP_012206842.1 hypothetical protein SPRG_12735 [Saprolegnia parasitica CBS 223.65]